MHQIEFEEFIRRRYRFDIYWSYFISIAFVIAGAILHYFQLHYKLAGKHQVWVVSAILILFGLCGIFVLRKKFKPSTLKNQFTKQQNISTIEAIAQTYAGEKIEASGSLIRFIYKSSWWQSSYAIFITADDNFIAVSVQSGIGIKGGFIDFGASKRIEKDILYAAS
ncbi:MAG: hypothetical protein QM726_13135 [Chitinophagaceae bacterium]